MLISHVADWMISSGRFSHTITRKIINSIGQFGPAIALLGASYTGCDPWLTVTILTIGMGLNGGIYSGFKVNHLDISPRFAGIMMSITNCLANLAGLLAPITAGYIILGRVIIVYLYYIIIVVVLSFDQVDNYACNRREIFNNNDFTFSLRRHSGGSFS